MSDTRFFGSIPALVTPLRGAQGEQIDIDAFQAHIEWQINSGSHALVPVGTTGESPTLSHDEHRQIVELCIKFAAGRVPVIAGAGSNNTAEAIGLARHAEAAGADGVLVVTPYYNKPDQDGLLQHFRAIDAAIGIPLIIYNIPGRSIIDMTPQTMATLHHTTRNIAGVKDATADVGRASDQRTACGKDFIQLSGEDISALGFNAHGGCGCISVTANVAPALCAQMQNACRAGKFDAALAIQDRLTPLHRALFLEPSPAPVKFALAHLGRMENRLRLPLTTVGKDTQKAIVAAMEHAGLIGAV